ncbi:2-dehydro-3-deoxy-6-phosphogalactonate aldolase [Ancylobacter pratisalsi]|uniref:2-dehydro-3-deoxy-6-phosphogalactonate aldolase n=1 Tax=Ancylobacter pratisalsi TaxID=1745854 RepID=A0A6P1YMH7_9HYPH|nr:2-dehydro-3-deoxy-6-phosphogalactonate aldolase [Ancylobacter pratisalsi]QIB34282.1 2-dehydro-3-deoxy-6-phosphogalactonate aldolase [Ancylobacter pratisalsi]
MKTAAAPSPLHVAWPNLRRGLVAILRGLEPHEAEAIVGTLIEEGLEAIEIPLNSPDPFRSIETAARLAPSGVLIGAGTVLAEHEVDSLAAAGGRLMVSPNVDPGVIARAGGHGMVTMPGVLTPTEAIAAVRAGASGLKFFPANLLGPAVIQAIAVVLPPATVVGAVGGVGERDFVAYAGAGIRTFGLGSSLYHPGANAQQVRASARSVIAAYDAVFSTAQETSRARD